MELLNNIPTVVTLIGLQAAGLLAIWGLFDLKLKARNKEKDELEVRISALYKEEIDALNKKVTSQGTKISEMDITLTRLTGENKLMRELLTGQDKDTQAWRGRTEQAMILVQEVAKLSAQNGHKSDMAMRGIEKIGKHLERLAVAIEKKRM